MATINLPGQTIGILGEGKRSERLQVAARERGYKVIVFSDQKSENLFDFASKANLLIFESDCDEADELQALQQYIEIPQLAETLSVTKDRLIEKVFLESLNINAVPYALITSIADLKAEVGGIGYPCVLKPIRVEKNQLSNVMLYSEEDFSKAEALLQTGSCILDAWVPFDRELTISFVSGKNGQLVPLPISETFYHRQVLQGAVTPARIPEEMADAIQDIGRTLSGAMNLSGIITIEFLVTAVGTIYAKKIITSVHHMLDYTLDATNISQYELFIRAVCGLPIPEVKMTQPVTSYLVNQDEQEQLMSQLSFQPDWNLRATDTGWLVNAMGDDWSALTVLLSPE